MPALVTCEGNLLETQWNVGSDDFVVPAFISIVLSLLCSTMIMATLAALWFSPECDDTSLHPVVYYSFFILLVIEVAILINEAVMMSVSYRGSIWNPFPRKTFPRYFYIRILLNLMELTGGIVCTVASFSPRLIEALECNSHRVALGLAKASVLVLWIKMIAFQLCFCLFLDPCGCFTPGFLQHLSFLDQADRSGEAPSPAVRDRSNSWLWRFLHLRKPPRRCTYEVPEVVEGQVKEGQKIRFWQRQVGVTQTLHGGITPEKLAEQISHVHHSYVGLRKLERRLRVWLCCLCVGGHRSRGIAVEDIARALYTLFDFEEDGRDSDVRLVLSDVIAGFKLLHRYQKDKMERLNEGARLEDKFREVTFDHMPPNQKPHYHYIKPKAIDNTNVKHHLLLDNLIHYMHYAMGIYGWPLHVFANLTCGLCQLATKTCCVCECCKHHDPERFHLEDRCMCGVAAMRQQASIEEEDVYYISMDNKIYKAPFAVCVDHKMKSVVIAVRGTLSIKDALTDMSYSLQHVEIDGVYETYVHKGMYVAACEIMNKLMGRTREEIKLEKSKAGEDFSEEDVEKSLSQQRMILNEIYSHEELKDYQLIITGHSLGAGVASVLALLLRKHYPDLHCYAFSAPGCVFSYPLACFSQVFITTIVLGNDIIPRLSFRSLLHLKQSVKHLLESCTKPKCEVIFQPVWWSRLRHTATEKHTLPVAFEEQIVSDNTTNETLQNAVFPPTTVTQNPPNNARKSLKKSFDVLTPQTFARCISSHVKTECGRFMPTFPPGKIFHLKVTKNSKPCFLGCCYPSEMEMERVRNEDLCMIIMDRGVVEDHMPHHVMDSLVRFKKQCIMPHYDQEKVDELKITREKLRNDHREAREQSRTGQFVFPCKGYSASDSTDLPSPPQQPSSQAPRLTHQPAMTTLDESCSSDSENEHPDQARSRIVEVEVHIEAASDSSSAQGSTLQEDVDFEQPVHQGPVCSEATNNDQELRNTLRPKLQREQRIHSHSDTYEPDDTLDQPLLTSATGNTKASQDIAKEPPALIPVSVPYFSSSLPAVPTERPKLKLSLPVKQNSASQTSSRLKRFLQLPHASTTPTTVLKLNARRGFQLKLKIPTEKTAN